MEAASRVTDSIKVHAWHEQRAEERAWRRHELLQRQRQARERVVDRARRLLVPVQQAPPQQQHQQQQQQAPQQQQHVASRVTPSSPAEAAEAAEAAARTSSSRQRRSKRGPTTSTTGATAAAAAAGTASTDEPTMRDDGAAPAHARPAGATAHEESARHRSQRDAYARQFMTPQWMDHVPTDLFSNWYMMPRPEGIRCVLVAHRNHTFSRRTNGTLLHRSFASALPSGAPTSVASAHTSITSSTGGSHDDFTLLDAIFVPGDDGHGHYYLFDIMCYRSHSLYDATTEVRLFFLHSRAQEFGSLWRERCVRNTFPLLLPPLFECRAASWPLAYRTNQLLARQDGIIFVHRQTHYVTGLTPLALVWNDAHCSLYHINTPEPGTVKQTVTLKYAEHGLLLTLDNYVVGLWSHVHAAVAAHADGSGDGVAAAGQSVPSPPPPPRLGDLLKFTIDGVREVDTLLQLDSDEQVPRSSSHPHNGDNVAVDEELDDDDDSDDDSDEDDGGDEGAAAATPTRMLDVVQPAPAQTRAQRRAKRRAAAAAARSAALLPIAHTLAAQPASALPLVHLTYHRSASRARVTSDPWHKILFQAHARVGRTIAADAIYAAMMAQEQAVAAAASASARASASVDVIFE